MLVVEDAHWADEATLDVLRILGRRITALPLLAIVTYRDAPGAQGDPLRVALGDLAGADGVSGSRSRRSAGPRSASSPAATRSISTSCTGARRATRST